jgi:hypothetical protein
LRIADDVLAHLLDSAAKAACDFKLQVWQLLNLLAVAVQATHKHHDCPAGA